MMRLPPSVVAELPNTDRIAIEAYYGEVDRRAKARDKR